MSEVTQKPFIVLGADHGGFEHKEAIKQWLTEQGYLIHDCGATVLDPTDDYPVFAQAVAKELLKLQNQGTSALGILLCRSDAGVVIAANRFSHIRAVGIMTQEQAEHARRHNDANVVAFSGDWMDMPLIKDCIQICIETPFLAEPRHVRRIEQLSVLPN